MLELYNQKLDTKVWLVQVFLFYLDIDCILF